MMMELSTSGAQRETNVGGDNSLQMVVSFGQLVDEGVNDICKEGILFFSVGAVEQTPELV